MKKYPLSFRLKQTFSKYSIPVIIGANTIGVPLSWYAIETGNPSGERTPVTGDAQYELLKNSAENIIRKDTSLQAQQAALVKLEQAQITNPVHKEQIEQLQKKNETDLAALKEDFRVFSRTLIASEGISEDDAIKLGKMIEYNTRYAAFTYSYQTSLAPKMARLDECQLKASASIKKAGDRLTNTESCINQYEATHIAMIGGYGGVIGLIIGALLLLPLNIPLTKLEEAVAEEKKRLDAMPDNPEEKDRIIETKIRTRVTKPPT